MSTNSGSNLEGSGTYETKAETQKSEVDFVKRWLAEIELASNEEKDWRKEAEIARNLYRAEKEGEKSRFNIVYSNIETECGVLYNSTPIPDVRPRDLDPDEKARLTSQTIERALNFSIDSYDLDSSMRAVIQDARLVGRGVGRVRYCPYEYQGKVYEDVCCEHVAWKHFRRGPANAWGDVPWVAFELFLTRDQLIQLSPEIGGSVALDFALQDGADNKPDAPPNVFKRARVWEIWDKQTRKAIFIAPSYSAKWLRMEDDPLGLLDFFPTPEPIYTLKTSDSLVPICPYRIYKALAEELEEVSVRIQACVRIAKWRGYQHPGLPSFERLEEAQDGELIPASEDIIGLGQAGGLDKFIWLMPLDQVVKLAEGLALRQQQIKQDIFEIMGISDIMRGATDPDETYGAQAIKAQSGSMRIKMGQKDVQRFVRDLFRLKGEVICNTFDPNNIQMMTRMQQPSRAQVQQAQQALAKLEQVKQQNPQMGSNGGPPMIDPDQLEQVQKAAKAVPWEDIVDLLRSGVTRLYRIDIETDSTIRGDLREEQANAAQFVQGTAAFVQAFTPLMESGMINGDVIVDLYTSFARFFKLGKQAEDALARLSQMAHEASKQPQPQQPSPEEIKAQAMAMQNQQKMQQGQQSHQQKMQQIGAKAQVDQQSAAMKAQIAQQQAIRDAMHDQRQADMEAANDQRNADLDYQHQQREAALNAQERDHEFMAQQRQAALDEFVTRQKADHSIRQMRAQSQMRRPN